MFSNKSKRTLLFFNSFIFTNKDRDLKHYMDSFGGILSMHNVKVKKILYLVDIQ